MVVGGQAGPGRVLTPVEDQKLNQSEAVVPEPSGSERLHPLDRMSRWLATIGGIVLIFMMLHIVVDVFMKYVFRAPVQGTLEIVSHYYMVIVVFLPLALVEWRREPIMVDVFFNMFPRGLKLACVTFSLALSVGIFAALAYRSTLDAMHAQSINEMAMGSAMTIVWPSRWALPIGFASSGLVCLWHLFGVASGRNRDVWLQAHEVDAEHTRE